MDGRELAKLINDLRDAIRDTEILALAATDGPWVVRNLGRHDQASVVVDSGQVSGAGLPVGGEVVTSAYSPRALVDARHIARHGPKAVLRGCQADSRTLVRCEEAFMAGNGLLTHFATETLREMADRYDLNRPLDDRNTTS